MFETACGALLYNDKTAKRHKSVAYSITDKPVTCKNCLRVIADRNTLSAEVECYIAIEDAHESPFISYSLDDLLEILEKEYGDELSDLLEKGSFTFYKGIETNIQVEVETFKKVLKLSEC